MILLKEIISGVISNDKVDRIDEKLSDYLPSGLNSAAAQAKKQGLRSIGFGRWVNKDGKVVAKTKDGKLQPVTPNEKTPKKDRNPKTKPLDPSNPGQRKPYEGPRGLSARKTSLKRKIISKVRQKIEKRLDTPEVQDALKTGRDLNEKDIKKLFGITPRIYRMVAPVSTDSPYPMRDLSIDVDGQYRLEYYPKTQTYKVKNVDDRAEDWLGNHPYWLNPNHENERDFLAKFKNHPLQMDEPIDRKDY